MRSSLRVALLLTTLTAAAAGRGEAQALGLPVNNAGVPSGIALYGDVGLPIGDVAGGTALGLTGRAGFGPLGATATVSHSLETDDLPNVEGGITSLGATLNYRLVGGPLIPLSATLQAGAGFWKTTLTTNTGAVVDEQTVLRFPVGVGIGLNVPNPAFSLRPWVAPRADVVRLSSDIGGDDTEVDFAVSAGVELNLLSGIGLHAAYDWSAAEGHPQTFGVGAHYAFRVPGL